MSNLSDRDTTNTHRGRHIDLKKRQSVEESTTGRNRDTSKKEQKDDKK